MLNSDSRKRSLVGRIALERGPASPRPLKRPPTIRMPAPRRLSRFGLAGSARLAFVRGPGSGLADRRVEIGAGGLRELLAQLIAQNAAAHLAHFALPEVAQLERPVGDADEPAHAEAEMLQHPLDLAVLAFPQSDKEPDIGALDPVDRRLHRAVNHALDRHAALQRVQR